MIIKSIAFCTLNIVSKLASPRSMVFTSFRRAHLSGMVILPSSLSLRTILSLLNWYQEKW